MSDYMWLFCRYKYNVDDDNELEIPFYTESIGPTIVQNPYRNVENTHENLHNSIDSCSSPTGSETIDKDEEDHNEMTEDNLIDKWVPPIESDEKDKDNDLNPNIVQKTVRRFNYLDKWINSWITPTASKSEEKDKENQMDPNEDVQSTYSLSDENDMTTNKKFEDFEDDN